MKDSRIKKGDTRKRYQMSRDDAASRIQGWWRKKQDGWFKKEDSWDGQVMPESTHEEIHHFSESEDDSSHNPCTDCWKNLTTEQESKYLLQVRWEARKLLESGLADRKLKKIVTKHKWDELI